MKRYPHYKDSGIAWLGEVPQHWELLKARYVFSFSKGLTITKEHLQDEGIPCINYGEIHSKYGVEFNPAVHSLKCVSEDFLEKYPECLLNYGDFVFADTSEDIKGAGNFSFLNSNQRTFAGYHTIIGRLKQNWSAKFIAYLMDSQDFRQQIQITIKGVKVFSITQAILKDAVLWLPPLLEQQAIAAWLDGKTAQIDALIRRKQTLLEKLAEKRGALISHAVTKGLNPAAAMKDSGVAWLGEVPQHWEVSKLAYLSESLQTGPFGSQLHANEYIENGTPLINPADIAGGEILENIKITVDEDVVKRLSRHKLEL